MPSAKKTAAKKTAAKKALAQKAPAKKAAAKKVAAKKTTLHKGDTVRWNTPQGQTEGKVVRQVTGTAHVDGPSTGHTAKASKAEPQVEVQSTKSGKKAIHKAGALKRV